MSTVNWYKVETNKEKEGTYHYIGSSNLSFEELAKQAKSDDFIRLDNLLYMERGEYKEWAAWDKSLEPSVFIRPQIVLSIMQFKADPRTVPNK